VGEPLNRLAQLLGLGLRQIFEQGRVSLAGIGPVAKLPDYDSIASRLKN
jgi:hypothetical protein